MYFYGPGINESIDSCYLFGVADGLNERSAAAETEVWFPTTGLDTILEITQSALKWTFYATTLFKKTTTTIRWHAVYKFSCEHIWQPVM